MASVSIPDIGTYQYAHPRDLARAAPSIAPRLLGAVDCSITQWPEAYQARAIVDANLDPRRIAWGELFNLCEGNSLTITTANLAALLPESADAQAFIACAKTHARENGRRSMLRGAEWFA